MTIEEGVYRLGPDDGTLSVRTTRTGAAAKAGHDLLIHVTSWRATLALGANAAASRLELSVDPTSLRVREGTGGMKALGDDDRRNIEKTIDDEILKEQAITFTSTSVEPSADGSGLAVQGELTLRGATRPVRFDVALGDDGALTATTVVKQTDFGMKPYSALFGTLKVADEVEVAVDARLPAPR